MKPGTVTGRSHGESVNKTTRCFFYHAMGHTMVTCIKMREVDQGKIEAGTGQFPDTRRCFRCDVIGHIALHCRKVHTAKEENRAKAGSCEMHDDAEENEEPGATCMEVSEPRCKGHGVVEGVCPCVSKESMNLAFGGNLRFSVPHVIRNQQVRLRCQCARERSGPKL